IKMCVVLRVDRSKNLVDLVGFEPTTSSMPWKRAPNCATGPLGAEKPALEGRMNQTYCPASIADSQTQRAEDFRNVWKLSILGRERPVLNNEPEASSRNNFPLPDLLPLFSRRADRAVERDAGSV